MSTNQEAPVTAATPHAWHTLSAGDGAKGKRCYRWALLRLPHAGPGHRALLARRNRRTGEADASSCNRGSAGG
ncbi:MAG TPA: hypothetical protein VGP70_28990 [Actinomadura sp.]|nr:hypothetical protein [Actinomadura sp.]